MGATMGSRRGAQLYEVVHLVPRAEHTYGARGTRYPVHGILPKPTPKNNQEAVSFKAMFAREGRRELFTFGEFFGIGTFAKKVCFFSS